MAATRARRSKRDVNIYDARGGEYEKEPRRLCRVVVCNIKTLPRNEKQKKHMFIHKPWGHDAVVCFNRSSHVPWLALSKHFSKHLFSAASFRPKITTRRCARPARSRLPRRRPPIFGARTARPQRRRRPISSWLTRLGLGCCCFYPGRPSFPCLLSGTSAANRQSYPGASFQGPGNPWEARRQGGASCQATRRACRPRWRTQNQGPCRTIFSPPGRPPPSPPSSPRRRRRLVATGPRNSRQH